MKTPLKLLLSAGVVHLGVLGTWFAERAGTLATNAAVVGQMANSDKAALPAYALGHAELWIDGLIWLAAALALILIWRRRPHTR